MPPEVDQQRVEVISDGSITEIRPETGGDSAFVRPKSRDEGLWQVYRGPIAAHKSRSDPLGGKRLVVLA